jgi:hypothetical protein
MAVFLCYTNPFDNIELYLSMMLTICGLIHMIPGPLSEDCRFYGFAPLVMDSSSVEVLTVPDMQ